MEMEVNKNNCRWDMREKSTELTHRTGWKWCYYGISEHIESEKRANRSVAIVGSSIFDSLLTVGQLLVTLVGRVHFHFNCFPTNPTEYAHQIFANSNAQANSKNVRACSAPHSIQFICNRFKHPIYAI